MKLKYFNILLTIMLIYFNNISGYETINGGNVSGNWSGTYYITSDITIPNGSTLTLLEGCILKFAPDTQLLVYGNLHSTGTAGSNVYFTSKDDNSVGEVITGSDGVPAAGEWDGIYLNGLSYAGIGNFDYTVVRYGGKTNGGAYGCNIFFNTSDEGYFRNSICEYSQNDGVRITSCSLNIANSILRNNGDNGLEIDASNSFPTITDNTFNNNTGYGAYINTNLTNYSGNIGSGNGINGFGISGSVKSNVTLSQGSSTFPYILKGSIIIDEAATLSLSSGTIIKGLPSTTLIVYGILDVNGETGVGNQVIFTSLNDDTYGGDTKGDNNDIEPAPGNWDGIYLNGSSHKGIGNFDYAIVRYGGRTNGGAYGCNIFFNTSDEGYFRNSICEYSQNDGVKISSCSLNIANNILRNNGDNGLEIDASNSYPTITDNTFNNNANYGAFINTNLTNYSGNIGSGNGINGFGISGSVNSNVTLSQGSSTFPYILKGNIIIDEAATLSLSAGTIFKGLPSTTLIVYGILDVNGETGVGNQVIFTSINDDIYGGDTKGDNNDVEPAPGNWDGIYLNGSSHKGIGNFDYAIVRYGGRTNGGAYGCNIFFNTSDEGYIRNSICEYSQNDGVKISSCSLNIANNILRNNGDNGLEIDASNSYPTITDNTFNNNANYGAYVNTNLTNYSGNTGSGNGVNGFSILGSVNSNVLLQGDSNFPFIINGNLIVNNTYTLTLSAGTIIKAGSNGLITVNGKLVANGTGEPLNPVVLTSINDDSYGGDTNGDNTTVAPAPGDWNGIYFNDLTYEGIGDLNYCYVFYGGKIGGTNYDSNIYGNTVDDFSFSNSKSNYSQKYGVYINSGSPTFSGSTFSDNGTNGIYLTSCNSSVTACTLNSNGSNALYVTGTSTMTINNNTFNNNAGYGVYLDRLAHTNYSGNSGAGNLNNGFGIYGGSTTGGTWTAASKTFPFIVIGGDSPTNRFELSGVLNIGDNTTLKFETGSQCYMYANNSSYISWSPTGCLWLVNQTTSLNQDVGVFRFSSRFWPNEWILSTINPGNAFTGGNYVTVDFDGDVSFPVPAAITNELILTKGVVKLTDVGSLTFSDGAKITRDAGSIFFTPNFGTNINLEYVNSSPLTIGNEVPVSNIINNFTVNGTGGLNLNKNIAVNGTLSLEKGSILTEENVLTLGSSTASLGTLSRNTGKIVGIFKRWLTNATIDNLLFPIGTTDNNRTAEIDFTVAPSAGGTLTASFISSNPGTNGLPLNDGGINLINTGTNGYWSIVSGDGLTGGTYNLDLLGEGFSGINNYQSLHLVKRTNSSSNWSLEGVHVEATGSNASPLIKRSDLTSFSEFALASTNENPLPIELISFKTQVVNNEIKLTWQTATEINNYGFEIQKSVKDIRNTKDEFIKIGFIEGKGNSNLINSYSFIDSNPSFGENLYRLMQIDNNGNVSYSEISVVEFSIIPIEFSLYQNYPNPFNPNTTIKFGLPVDSKVQLIVYSSLGEKVATLVDDYLEAGYHSINFSANNLASGMYFYSLNTDQFKEVKKMTLIK